MEPRDEYDVVVVGGGPAGVAAAVSAAETGARTLLVEARPNLGGNVSNAFVHTICGLYHAAGDESDSSGDAASASPRYAQLGFARRVAETLLHAGFAGRAERAGKVYYLPIDPEGFASFATTKCSKTKNLEWRTRCSVTAVELASDELDASHRIGLGESCVLARIVLDTSGDGNVAELGDAAFSLSTLDTLQTASYAVQIAGVDPEPIRGLGRLKLSAAIARAAKQGQLPESAESVTFRPALQEGKYFLILNLPRTLADAKPFFEAGTQAEVLDKARENVEEVLAFLRSTRAGFEAVQCEKQARSIGVREARRLVGRAKLDEFAVAEGREHPDEVAISTWPIELWEDHRGARFQHTAGPCSIPLGALISASHPRLGMAGRCLSASHEALGALRVIGTSLATGEAIGIAAALAADAGETLAAIAPEKIRAHIQERAEGDSSE